MHHCPASACINAGTTHPIGLLSSACDLRPFVLASPRPPQDVLDLIEGCLSADPASRPTAAQALQRLQVDATASSGM